MLRGTNHTRNARALGEIPVSPSLMTLSDFQAVQLPPPAARAPRTNLPPLRKFTFGLASPATTSRIHDQETSDVQQQSLSQQPLTALVAEPLRDRIERFAEALTDALQLSDTMVASDESDPVDHQTLLYAIQSLAPLVLSLKISPPLILPLQNGGIGAEWHTSGMNIELRFRKPYDIYAVLEDARGAIEPFHSRDPDLVHARSALCELSTRSVE
jgi:hypothetical protein